MKYTVITATPNTTYTHYEIEADSPEEASRKAEAVADGYVDEDVEEVGVSTGPNDEPSEVIDVSAVEA